MGANLAEAWAKRRYEAHFKSKLTDADGEKNETICWLQHATQCGYVSAEDADRLIEQCNRIGAMLGRMLASAPSFCRPPQK